MASMTSALRLTLRTCSKISARSMLKTWHRMAGLFAAVFLLLLTVTGLLLMQADDLDLNNRYVSNDGVLDWYGIRPAPPPLTFAANKNLITQVGGRLYFESNFLLRTDSQLIGATPAADEILVATTDGLVLVTTGGKVAEKMDETVGIPHAPTHLGTIGDGTIVLKSADGLFIFEPLSARFQSAPANLSVRWQDPTVAPAGTIEAINRNYRGTGLTLERIIIDLHTGRLLGPLGVTLITIASILLLVLIVSGIILWTQRALGNGANGSSD